MSSSVPRIGLNGSRRLVCDRIILLCSTIDTTRQAEHHNYHHEDTLMELRVVTAEFKGVIGLECGYGIGCIRLAAPLNTFQ